MKTPDYKTIANQFRCYAALSRTYADAAPPYKDRFKEQAQLWITDANRVELDGMLVEESLELLARLNALKL